MKYPLVAILLILGLLLPNLSNAQKRRFNPKQRFHAGIITGVNLSQIDGDDYSGYDKVGIMGGLQGIALLNRRTKLVAELLYSEKGSRVENEIFFQSGKNRLLAMNYAEVPILIRFSLLPEDANVQFEVEAGLAFSRLIQTKIEENVELLRFSYTEIEDQFRRSDLSYIIGGHAEFFPNFNIGMRSNMSLNKFYAYSDLEELDRLMAKFGNKNIPYRHFRNFHLTFYVSYQIY
ncbi:MAG: porin family protein [Bacteroidota bacterium]